MKTTVDEVDELILEAFEGRVIKSHNGLFLITDTKIRDGIFLTGWLRHLVLLARSK